MLPKGDRTSSSAAETHHSAYLLSHVRTVAMNGAFMTLGLPVSELAPVEPRSCVIQ